VGGARLVPDSAIRLARRVVPAVAEVDEARARITCTFKDSSGCGPTVLSIVRMNGSPDGYARYDQFAFNNPPSGSTSYFWTDQVYDGGNNRSQACINLDAGSLLAECSAPF
jgi:hypothetical protein